jgi:hypothetical protein
MRFSARRLVLGSALSAASLYAAKSRSTGPDEAGPEADEQPREQAERDYRTRLTRALRVDRRQGGVGLSPLGSFLDGPINLS